VCSQECKGSGAFARKAPEKLRSNPGVNSQMRVPCGMHWSANNPSPWMGLGVMVVLTNSIAPSRKDPSAHGMRQGTWESPGRFWGGAVRLHSILLHPGLYSGGRSPHLSVASCTLTCWGSSSRGVHAVFVAVHGLQLLRRPQVSPPPEVGVLEHLLLMDKRS
jgi:hypothetical protein